MRRTVCNAAKVNCKEAVTLLKDHAYLDVRTDSEFAAGHIEGAPVTNVPVWQKNAEGGFEPNPDFVATVEQAFPDKSGNIVVACASGKRSAAAVAALEQAGYTSLKDMSAGFNGKSVFLNVLNVQVTLVVPDSTASCFFFQVGAQKVFPQHRNKDKSVKPKIFLSTD